MEGAVKCFLFFFFTTTSHDVEHYSQNVCDYSDTPAERREEPNMNGNCHMCEYTSSEEKKKKRQVHILPHIRLQSKWLIVDYFWRCKAQRNELFNSNQMLRSETAYHPLTRFTSHASVGVS